MAAVAMMASMSQELNPVLKALGPCVKNTLGRFPMYALEHDGREILLLETGIGRSGCVEALRSMLENGYEISYLISFGFAGALRAEEAVGDVILGTAVGRFMSASGSLNLLEGAFLNGRTPETLLPERSPVRLKPGVIITVEQIIPKASLSPSIPSELPSPVVDMESYFLAEEARKHEIPGIFLRAVSDPYNQEIVLDLSRLTDEKGRIRLLNALMYFAGHPSRIPMACRLWKNASKAAISLSLVLPCILQEIEED